MSDYIRYLQPSGGDDTVAIQAAVDDLIQTYGLYNYWCGTLVLDGHFSISSPISVNTRVIQDAGTKTACQIVGVGGAAIEYTGAVTTDYMLKFYGTSRHRIPLLESISLNCEYKCRGLLIDECGSYRTSMSDVAIFRSTGVGIELVSNWGSSFENVRILTPRGIALRATNFIGSGWRNLHVAQQPVEAAHWPATDDTTVTDMNGDPIQTADANRAAVVVTGGNQSLHETMFEGCYATTYPLMFLGAANALVSGLYMEGNSYSASSIVFQGGSDTDGRTTFQNIIGDWGIDGAGGHDSFLELRGNSSNVRVTDGEFLGFGSSIVRATAGTHTGIQVERVKTTSDAIAEASWVVAEGAATVDRTTSISGSARVQSTDAIYLGDASTDGSWRLIRDEVNLVRQLRVGGEWVTKGTDTP